MWGPPGTGKTTLARILAEATGHGFMEFSGVSGSAAELMKFLADSREMFDEAAIIIMNGLETGFVEADTKHFKQPRIEVRPRPTGWTRR